MKKYRVVIVEDEINNVLILKHFIEKYCINVEVVAEILSITEAVSIINETKPDILFLDIRINGKEIFEILDQVEITKAQVIFITSHDEYALKAIKYNAIDYLLKPIVIEELIISINKAILKIEQQMYFDFVNSASIDKILSRSIKNHDYIAVAYTDKIELLKVNEIVYLEADSKYATFYMSNGKVFISNKNLLHYESVLDKTIFFRIHKSYIINIKFLTRVLKKDGSYCELFDGVLLPIAKRKQEEFNRFLKIKD